LTHKLYDFSIDKLNLKKNLYIAFLTIVTYNKIEIPSGKDGINTKGSISRRDNLRERDGADGRNTIVVNKLLTVTNWNYDSSIFSYYVSLNVSSIYNRLNSYVKKSAENKPPMVTGIDENLYLSF
jgi:hypothetical protein